MHQDNFYVYTHTRLDTDQVFYVGIGKTPKPNKVWKHNTKYSRAYEKAKRHKFWKNVTNKVEYKVDIVYESSNEEIVKLKEIELISLYGRRCCDASGTLVNFDPGGGRAGGPRSYGIKINQLDKNTKNVIKVWNELKDIEAELGYLKTNIIKCCRKKQVTAYGYLWEYTNDRSYDHIRPTAARKKTNNNRVGLTVTNKITNEKIFFRSIGEASKKMQYHRSTIQKYLSKKNENKTFVFEWNKWTK
jgi:hypothetical protein